MQEADTDTSKAVSTMARNTPESVQPVSSESPRAQPEKSDFLPAPNSGELPFTLNRIMNSRIGPTARVFDATLWQRCHAGT